MARRATQADAEVQGDAKLRGDPANPDFKVADWPFYLIARTARRYEMDMEEALRRIDMDVPSWRGLPRNRYRITAAGRAEIAPLDRADG